MDPSTIKVKNSKGEEEEILYAPKRIKDIVTECYILSRKLHTSYNDIMQITPLERSWLLQLVAQENEEKKKEFEKEMQEAKERIETIKSKKK